MTNITTHNETVLCDDGNYCSDVMGGRKYTRHKIIHFHPTTRIANSSYCQAVVLHSPALSQNVRIVV